ncbi:hypothetical protein SDC9_72564 [bioreactor metagenome]|uniref:Copper amine oxidase-like N-terminal domain-containing protein n=1 Tax=bioreactor metagenome TaxID=1076179 RepID=A0A644YHV2_9ZZZZ|nr:hypothetical protein [Candidatus Metalachnospira sp.]
MKIFKITIIAAIMAFTLSAAAYGAELTDSRIMPKTVVYVSNDGGATKYTGVDSFSDSGSTYYKLRDISNILGISVDLNLDGLKSINFDDYNYYKIRDLAERSDFSCVWDERTSTIRLDNRYSYSAENKLGKAKAEGQVAVKESIVNGYMSLMNGDKVNHHPVIDADVTYFADSKDYYEITQYIKTNIDNDFNLNNYWVNEIYDNPCGLNELYLHYKVIDIPSDYYYAVKVVNNSVFLITEVGKINDDIYTVNLVKPEITDEQLKALAIKADALSSEKNTVDEQKITKRFIMESIEFKYEVETVYKDNEGLYFCELFTYEG